MTQEHYEYHHEHRHHIYTPSTISLYTLFPLRVRTNLIIEMLTQVVAAVARTGSFCRSHISEIHPTIIGPSLPLCDTHTHMTTSLTQIFYFIFNSIFYFCF